MPKLAIRASETAPAPGKYAQHLPGPAATSRNFESGLPIDNVGHRLAAKTVQILPIETNNGFSRLFPGKGESGIRYDDFVQLLDFQTVLLAKEAGQDETTANSCRTLLN